MKEKEKEGVEVVVRTAEIRSIDSSLRVQRLCTFNRAQ